MATSRSTGAKLTDDELMQINGDREVLAHSLGAVETLKSESNGKPVRAAGDHAARAIGTAPIYHLATVIDVTEIQPSNFSTFL